MLVNSSPKIQPFPQNILVKPDNITFSSRTISSTADDVFIPSKIKEPDSVKKTTGLEDLKKSKALASLACLWSKTTKSRSFLINGHLDELKQLQKNGTVVIYAPKHYDGKDVPSLVKLFDSVTDSVSDFSEKFPFFMRTSYEGKLSLKQKAILAIKDNMGAFVVDTSGGTQAVKALRKAISVVENGKPLMIFPEGVSGLKYSGEPISEAKQTVQPIQKGLAFIVSRLIASKQKESYPKNFKVVVVPIGISGETCKDNKPASLFVGKPVNIFGDLSDKVAFEKASSAKVDIINDVIQDAMQTAQYGAYKAYNEAIKK